VAGATGGFTVIGLATSLAPAMTFKIDFIETRWLHLTH